MTVARSYPHAIFMDEKIYVIGGCNIDDYSASWVEVFDMKTQSWTALPGPGADNDELRSLIRGIHNYRILNAFEGKIYIVIADNEYTYEPKDGTWKFVREQCNFHSPMVWCEIENVIYGCTFFGDLNWSDTGSREWRYIKGLENLREIMKSERNLDMVNYGGKLLVLWDDRKTRNKIRYAKISLESRCNINGRDMWGEIECVEEFTFPSKALGSFCCLTASV